jgi:hypothetical protein
MATPPSGPVVLVRRAANLVLPHRHLVVDSVCVRYSAVQCSAAVSAVRCGAVRCGAVRFLAWPGLDKAHSVTMMGPPSPRLSPRLLPTLYDCCYDCITPDATPITHGRQSLLVLSVCLPARQPASLHPACLQPPTTLRLLPPPTPANTAAGLGHLPFPPALPGPSTPSPSFLLSSPPLASSPLSCPSPAGPLLAALLSVG